MGDMRHRIRGAVRTPMPAPTSAPAMLPAAALTVALAVMLIAGPAVVLAHHSFQAEFDIAKPMTMKGVVTKVEWINPHVYVHLDVKDARGTVTSWAFETLGPVRMSHAGLSKKSYDIGKVITM